MKKIFGYLMLTCLFAQVFISCEDADSIHRDFVVEGGLIYPGKASSARAQPGRYQILISWLRGTDPSVTRATIYWDNYLDSVQVTIPPTGDTIKTLIGDLEEKTYVFNIVTYDAAGNASIPVELLTGSYGDKYQETLLSRPLNRANLKLNGSLTLEWGSADISNGAFSTEVYYKDAEGKSGVAYVDAENASFPLPAIERGSALRYRTVYVPEGTSIDTFYTEYLESDLFSFDKTEWEVVDFSSQHGGPTNAVTNVIDGTEATRWHSLSGGGSRYPHHVTIDMGGERTLTGFGVWRTTFENGGDDRAPDKIQFLASLDNSTWTDLGVFDFNRFLNGEQFFDLAESVEARYFKLVGVSGPNASNFVLGEVSAYGY